ncbi:maleylpyruvate isomerase family mycothiol-dependent enzyme [Nakamurella leprariae]|uniref:Maleylpyruvate isomerase family mycothiol-dependent enzyme n=1 Tax=Nakamurella leprariae TaxID=2803911 RepID=A0A939C105_9ACTN|nr:maleylpyruvate isomerase family mycothiol-dependent enzyme [Nakamurella leprariae]MBM9466677.1 maleylpyruvate isomerase family mycothiol-dependent enzyme [Nakamurella leprariae]
MSNADLWTLVHAERAALADDLRHLDEPDWATPSLCDGWTVRDAVAHLTVSGVLSGPRWLAGVIRCRFDFDRQVAMRLAEQLGDSGADTLRRFCATVTSTTAPPLPKLALLGEVVVHGTDIRRPLGLVGDHPIDTLTRVAAHYAGTDQVVVARRRVAGLELQASDGPFATGRGPVVIGPTLSLIMAMTGRVAAVDDLAGPGVPVLRHRC